MEIKLPKMKAGWFARPTHTIVALLVGYFCIDLIFGVGGQIFGGADENSQTHGGIKHLVDMLVFGLVGFAIVGFFLYVMRFTALQAIFLPFFDELVDLAKKWRTGKLTQAEATFALALAICTAATVLGALHAISMFATPL